MATTTAEGNTTKRSKTILNPAGDVTIELEYTISGGSLLGIFEEIRQYYIALAKHTIIDTFEDPEKVTVIVDGKTNGNIEFATLNGSGIVAFEYGSAGVEEMEKAFKAAISHIYSVTSGFRRTGFYESAITVRVNGELGYPDWNTATNRINIQIFSEARYAAPLEVIKQGNIFLGARNKAKAAGGELVNVSFTYRDPIKMGQREEFAKRSGEQFTPLAVPVIEIGTQAGGVSNYVGNVSRNLNRKEAAQRLKRTPPQRNLIHRGIVSHDRWHNTLPTRPK